MKTAIVHLNTGKGVVYYVIDGDLSKFDGVQVNAYDEYGAYDETVQQLEDEFCEIFWGVNGVDLHQPVSLAVFRQAIVDGAMLIETSFLD